jgi:hypothetical protein
MCIYIYTHNVRFILGFRESRVHDMQRQGVSHLGYMGAETPKLIYPFNSLRGFTSQDFAMCDDKKYRI